MNCCIGCCFLLYPNTFTSIEISNSIQNDLYKNYIKKIKKTLSFNTIYFQTEYLDKLNVSKTVATKLFNELNKLNLKKYSFWNLVNIDYVVLQISYYLFAKLIDDNYEFFII